MKKRSQTMTTDSSQPQSLTAEAEGPVTFTLGRQLFAPIQYNNFEVGPFKVTLQPKAAGPLGTHNRETYGEMQERATEILQDMFDIEFERSLNNFLDKIGEMAKIVQARKRR